VVLITGPHAIREVLVEHASRFRNRDVMLNMALLLGESTMRRHLFTPRGLIARCCGCAQERSLLATDGELHDNQRAAMLEAFHGPALERYREVMVALTERMVDDWGSGREVELTAEMQQLTASIVFQTLFGVDVQERSDAIVNAYRNMLRHSPSPFRPWIPVADKRKEIAWGELMNVVDRILEQAVARTAGGGSTLLVDLMLRSERSARASQTVRDQVSFFMAAGHLTVSGALVWALSLLAKHPNVLAKLTDELRTVLGGSAPRIRDLPKLNYLEFVVKETLRLYPAVWLHGRRAAEECEIDGWHLPKGTFVLFSQWVTQRAEEHFSDPLQFIPERFSPGKPYLHTSSAYFPFGIGARACLGSGFATLEAKIVLAIVLQRFAPVLLDDEQLAPTTHYVLLQPRGEVRVRMDSLRTHSPEAPDSAECWTRSSS
jgi:cytochrome P450